MWLRFVGVLVYVRVVDVSARSVVYLTVWLLFFTTLRADIEAGGHRRSSRGRWPTDLGPELSTRSADRAVSVLGRMKPDPSTILERVSAVHRSEHPRYGTRDYKAVMFTIILSKGVRCCAVDGGAPTDRAALTVTSV